MGDSLIVDKTSPSFFEFVYVSKKYKEGKFISSMDHEPARSKEISQIKSLIFLTISILLTGLIQLYLCQPD